MGFDSTTNNTSFDRCEEKGLFGYLQQLLIVNADKLSTIPSLIGLLDWQNWHVLKY